MIHEKYDELVQKQEKLITKENKVDENFYNGIYDRYENPVITRHHVPVHWRFDLNKETNPHFLERLGANATLNPGAIYFEGKYYLVIRFEGDDRKSIFALAVSDNGVDNCRFIDTPLTWEDRSEEHTSELQSRGHLVCRLLL